MFLMILCVYNRAEDLGVLDSIKVEEADMYIIYYLVKLLEENQEDEDMVEMILGVLLIPVVFTLHPENHALNPD